MFFQKTLLILAFVVNAASATKFDCWADWDCSVVLTRSNSCTLPTGFCGNQKSKEECYAIGAKSACVWGECPSGCMNPMGVWGDPHFQTWTGEIYDFHGVCDLLFFESESHNMTIQVRTTERKGYSFVENAAIQLNGDIVEFGGWGTIMVNGVLQAVDTEIPETIGGYPLKLSLSNRKYHTFEIPLGHEESLEIKTFRDFVGVKVNAAHDAYQDSRGLMGSAKTGQKLGRDGVTVFDDDNAFGQEWQVLDTEESLFDSKREPQFPKKCYIPTPLTKESRRRLGETIARSAAEEACAKWGLNKEACIMDVMATGDLEYAAGAF